jgi:hypothetical protein
LGLQKSVHHAAYCKMSSGDRRHGGTQREGSLERRLEVLVILAGLSDT